MVVSSKVSIKLPAAQRAMAPGVFNPSFSMSPVDATDDGYTARLCTSRRRPHPIGKVKPPMLTEVPAT
jgi:hypothetical protein